MEVLQDPSINSPRGTRSLRNPRTPTLGISLEDQTRGFMGMLNNEDIKGQISPCGRGLSEAWGRFKKVDPARPQLWLMASQRAHLMVRAERTGYT